MKLRSLSESEETLEDDDVFGNIFDLKSRNLRVERMILNSKDYISAYSYAYYAIKGRWPEAEEIIKKSPQYTFLYARNVIKGRWPEGEEVIKKYPGYAYIYTKDVIKGRWPEAEETIKTDAFTYRSYREYFSI